MFSQKTCCSGTVLVKTSQYPPQKKCAKLQYSPKGIFAAPKIFFGQWLHALTKLIFLEILWTCDTCKPDKKFWGKMLTWVWLARAVHELTKPKSKFVTPKFGGRWSHTSLTKYFWGKMLTLVWLALIVYEVTKPKSTFAAPIFFVDKGCILCSCDAHKPDKKFRGKMLTLVWLAHAELTEPKSTFAAPKIFCRQWLHVLTDGPI